LRKGDHLGVDNNGVDNNGVDNNGVDNNVVDNNVVDNNGVDNNVQKKTDNVQKKTDNVQKKSDNEPTMYKCRRCGTIFTRKYSLNVHVKLYCKVDENHNNIYNFDTQTFGRKLYGNSGGDIYIVRTDFLNEDVYKIGITQNLRGRLSNYRCGSTYEPRLLGYCACPNIKRIDESLKKGLIKYNIKREIYKGDLEEIKKNIIRTVIKMWTEKKFAFVVPELKTDDIIECQYCYFLCYNKDEYHDHKKQCKNYAVKQLCCLYCGKKYGTKGNLNKHSKICKRKEIVDVVDKRMQVHTHNLEEIFQKLLDQLLKKSGETVSDSTGSLNGTNGGGTENKIIDLDRDLQCQEGVLARFLDNDDDDERINNIKREIKLVLYNNKYLPERQKKLMEVKEKIKPSLLGQ